MIFVLFPNPRGLVILTLGGYFFYVNGLGIVKFQGG